MIRIILRLLYKALFSPISFEEIKAALLDINIPKIKNVLKEKVGPITRDTIENDELMSNVFNRIYGLMFIAHPFIGFLFRRLIKPEPFVSFCMKNRTRLVEYYDSKRLPGNLETNAHPVRPNTGQSERGALSVQTPVVAERILEETETVLRDFNGQNLYTQQVRNFTELKSDLPIAEQSRLIFKMLRDRCSILLEESGDKLSSDTWAKLHFMLGRLNFLLGEQQKARGYFLNAERHGMHQSIVFYNVAMTFAVEEDKDSRQETIASLQMVINSAGVNSKPGIEAALHIKLIEMSNSS